MKTDTPKFFWNDPSLWILFFANLFTIYLAVNENWSLSTIMWIYWFQSVIIGFFNLLRIIGLREVSEGEKIDEMPIQPTRRSKTISSLFFVVHYGMFHFGFLAFLGQGAANLQELLSHIPKQAFLPMGIFFFNHLFSYVYNRARDARKQYIGALMFYPYVRIIPMHLTMFFEAIFGGALIFFLLLKTLADCIMHTLEHRALRKSEALSSH